MKKLEGLLKKVHVQNAAIKKEQVRLSGIKKRSYTEIKDLKFADDPEWVIDEADSYLLKVLKQSLIEGGYTYGDFLGEEKIIYSTFYNIKSTKKINFEIFERFMRVASLTFEIVVGDKEDDK